jgi:hypothetical protein
MYQQGVQDRKEERERKKKIKDLTAASEEVPNELLVPIPDREKAWQASQEEIKRLLEEQHRQDDKEVTFVTDFTGNQSLRVEEDFIPIPEFSDTDTSSSEEPSLDDSEVYDSEKD